MSSGFKPGTSLNGPLTQTDYRQASHRAWQGKLPAGWEPAVALQFIDFLKPSEYNESVDWDVVESGSGSRAVVQSPYGLLRLTTGGTSTNFEAIFLKDLYWTTTSGQRLWHKSRVKLGSSATTQVALMGLSSGSPNERIAFELLNGSSSIVVSTAHSGVATRLTLPGTYDLTSFIELAFVTDGQRVDYYVNNQRVATISTNIPPSSQTLRTSYQLITMSANARMLDIDYLMTAQQRKPGDQD